VLACVLTAVSCGNDVTPAAPSLPQTRVIGVVGALVFGNVTVGTSATLTVTITNSGTGPLTITNITVTTGLADVFTPLSTTATVAPGGAQAVIVRFTPKASGPYVAALTVLGDQTSGTSSILMSGSGAVPKASFVAPSASGDIVCQGTQCTSFTYTIQNVGVGCATSVTVVTRFYGADGAGPQLGIDVPMGLPGGSLATFLFRPGASATIQNLAPFNDVMSAHTTFRPFFTWTDVVCP
jgi:hypothetical protein